MLAPLMKNEVATNPAYRKVVAALDDCEKRYDSLIKWTGATNDLRLASTVAVLKGEVEQRRRLEVELLRAGLCRSSLKQQGIELLFLATPHEVSRALVPESVAEGIRVIDLSGAWRLKQAQHRAIYGFKDEDAVTAAELTQKAVYGLPELNADQIPSASIVANPGCYATTVILGLAPLLKAGLADREKGIIADSKSGVSGAGKEPTSRRLRPQRVVGSVC